jgi:hypothetical protein
MAQVTLGYNRRLKTALVVFVYGRTLVALYLKSKILSTILFKKIKLRKRL